MKLRIAFLAALTVAGGIPAQPAFSADSIFPDKKLEAAVRQYVFAKKQNEEPLVAEDVKDLSTIHGDKKGIKDLRGLEKCVSLAELSLAGNEISDLAPLAELKNVQLLDLAGNRVADLKPLAGLKRLQYLNLAGNQVKDLSPLAELTSMNSLYLTGNQVADLGPLKGLQKLWTLYAGENRITGIETLASLTWLSSLELRGNRIEDLKPLAKLRELRQVFLEDNRIADLAPLVQAAQADAKGEKRFAPFLRLYLNGNPLNEESKKALETLKGIGVRVTTGPRARKL